MNGYGDGTNWSSERGNGTGYSGSQGNAGNGAGSSSNGKAYGGGLSVNPKIGEKQAKKLGINPAEFVGYTLGINGELIGITKHNLGDAYGVNLGYPEESTLSPGQQNNSAPGGSVPYNLDISDARVTALKKIIQKNARLANSTQSGTSITAARQATLKAKLELSIIMEARKLQPSYSDLQDGIRLVTDFYKNLSERISARVSFHAQYFTEEIKGKKLRSVNDAIKSFEQYKVLNGSKFNSAERKKLGGAVRKIDYVTFARDLNLFSRGLGFYGAISDFIDVIKEIALATQTNNWRNVIVKLEKLVAGKLAAALTAFAFSIILGTGVGIVGYAIIMALVGSLVNDSLINNLNSKMGFK